MNPAIEQASRQYVEAHDLRCPECSSSKVYIQLPPPRRQWSQSKLEEELKRGALTCRSCRGGSPASESSRPEDEPSVSPSPTSCNDGAAGRSSQGNRQPGAAAVTAYLAGMLPTSRRGMRDALTIVAKLLGKDEPSAVAWHDLRFERTSALQAEVVASGRSPDYCKKICGALRGVLKASETLGLMTREDLERAIRLPKIRGSRIRKKQLLRDGDLAGLLASTRSDTKSMRSLRDRALLALVDGGGLRRAEAACVTTDHFDRETRVLTVRGKGDKERQVPLPQWAAKAIVEFIDARGFNGPIICPVSQRGVCERRALSGGQATYVVARRLWRRAELEPVGVHAFRRDFCQRVVDAGADIFTTQQLLGHSDPKTTAGYAQRTVEKLAVATDRLADPERSDA